jgi:Kef-type K+ transport system membrane component KefB
MVLDQAWSLLLVSVAAALLPGVSRIVRLPAIVLEILFGVLLGKSLLNLEFSGEWLPFLAELGFLLLMFQAGMEIDFSMLRRQKKSQVFFQLTVFACTVAVAMAAAVFLGRGLFLGLVLSTTSLGLVVPTLKEARLSQQPLGQSIIIASTLADFLTLFAITFYVLWHRYGLDWRFLGPLPLFVGFGILLRIGRLWAWWHPNAAARLLAPHETQELGVRLSLALLFLFVAMSELAGLEPVLGAFMGGALLSILFREKIHLESKLSGIAYGFLIPLFFIHVGMQFDLRNILTPRLIIFTLELFGFALAVKVLPSLLFVFNGVSLRRSITIGLLLSSRLSLIIVAATIGLEYGFITEEYKDVIILLAVFTCLLGPSAFKVLHRPTGHEDEGGGAEKKMATGRRNPDRIAAGKR